MKIETLADVARYIRKQYSKRVEKESKKGLWVKIEEQAYELYGSQFGYTDMHLFKSDLTRMASNQRKEFPSSIDNDEKEILRHLNNNRKPSIEGADCFSFTFHQIKNLGLNSDSYF